MFFRDALINYSRKLQSNASTTGKPKPKAAPASSTLDTSHINPYKRIVHAIHTGEGMTHGPSHLSMWIPFFVQAGVDFVVIVRNRDLFNWVIREFPYVDVVYAKTPQDIENVFLSLPVLKAIYYISNTGNLIHSLRFNDYQHIFLGHGDSDKTASAHKFFRVYDQVWVAGQAHIDRFANTGFNTAHMEFVKIGRPTLANVIKLTDSDWRQRPLHFLYLPTWEGVYEEGNYSSVTLAAQMLQHLATTYNAPVTTKFHPVTGSRNKMLANVNTDVQKVLEQTGVEFAIANRLTPVSDLLLNANIFICDISAVVSECIAANGPIFVYIPQDKEIKIAKSNMDYNYYAYTFSTLEELYSQLEQVLNGNDYKAQARQEAREYLLGKTQTQNDEFIAQVQAISQSVIDSLNNPLRDENAQENAQEQVTEQAQVASKETTSPTLNSKNDTYVNPQVEVRERTN
ncbi:CDP-glycerol glycerophosphotransferase family protein [Psittacicella hinzii]|uniref:CDP-Glycerol:Poly(Glycerophosphate) glycerophosphotransferase n=1 Tax=Psittacicella hinzii TaxID=2028575 RepID=A0A3A1YT31_9GAMM|nr:CDP-glycerol glycerophosphotransferase family protein [Psittacicella hinzii]RIY40795.1 hypothetical protein CKF58_00105 [Psittacicella hinzii]